MLEREIRLIVTAEKTEKMPKDHQAGRLLQRDPGVYIGFAPLASEEAHGEWIIGRWTWRETQKAMIQTSEIIDEKRGLAQLDLVRYEEEMMKTCVKGPVEITEEFLMKLDPDLGDLLVDACRRVNGLPMPEKTAFLEQSEPDKATPG
jgi:hypothetical protein